MKNLQSFFKQDAKFKLGEEVSIKNLPPRGTIVGINVEPFEPDFLYLIEYPYASCDITGVRHLYLHESQIHKIESEEVV